MKTCKAVGLFLAVCTFVAFSSLYAPPGAATKTTDQSDLWWVHTESGWGIQLVQNNNTIFATLFVYEPDGQPTWYSATLTFQGSFNWSGTLYKTMGPWFGAQPFDSSTVTYLPVGTMSVNNPSVASGTLIYTVNGVQVVKAIERQLLVYEDFNGSFSGVMSQQGSGLPPCSPADNTDAASAAVNVTQDGISMTVVITARGDTCTYPGTYNQFGHFGTVVGSYICTSGATGTFNFFEMVRNFSDFRARTSITTAAGCTLKGYLLGLTQPPVPQ